MATNVRRVTWKRPDPALVRQFAEFPVANIGDAMERLDIMDGGITPIWDGARCVGTALPIYVTAGDNLAVIEALELIREGDVVCVNAGGFTGRAIMGDNLAQRFELFGATGAIVDGCVRDQAIIRDLGFPVFARGLSPAGPWKNGPGRIGEPIALGGVVINAGDIIAADADGVAVIRPDAAPAILEACRLVAATEAEKDAEVVTLRAARAARVAS